MPQKYTAVLLDDGPCPQAFVDGVVLGGDVDVFSFAAPSPAVVRAGNAVVFFIATVAEVRAHVVTMGIPTPKVQFHVAERGQVKRTHAGARTDTGAWSAPDHQPTKVRARARIN